VNLLEIAKPGVQLYRLGTFHNPQNNPVPVSCLNLYCPTGQGSQLGRVHERLERFERVRYVCIVTNMRRSGNHAAAAFADNRERTMLDPVVGSLWTLAAEQFLTAFFDYVIPCVAGRFIL